MALSVDPRRRPGGIAQALGSGRRPGRAAVVALLAGLSATGLALEPAATLAQTIDQAAAPDAPEGPSLIAAITARLRPLLPAGMRLDGVTLACAPPPAAVLSAVAPGLTQLQSRTVLIELMAGARRLVCPATIAAERRVIVAARDLAAGDLVSAADLRDQWVDAFSISSGVLTELPAQPLISATALRAGQPIYAGELSRPLAIRPGDWVTLIVKNGPVTVRTQLQARAGAALGDDTALINPTTGAPITATVTGDKTAELVLE